jgi:L-malate glycosyltransferase
VPHGKEIDVERESEATGGVPIRRIAYVSHSSHLGGAELSLLDLLSELDRRRFEPRVFLPRAGDLSAALSSAGIGFDFVPALRSLRRRGGPLRRAGSGLAALGSWLSVDRQLARWKPALLHANSTTAALFSVGPARWRGIPIVWHVRDVVPLGALGGFLARRCTRVIAVSRCAAQAVGADEPPGKVVRIHNGIDVSRFANGSRDRGRRRLGVGDAPLVLSIGQIVPWKNHGVLLDAARRVHAQDPTVRFCIAGGDEDGARSSREERKALEGRIAREGLEGVVRLLGFQRDVPDLLAAADVFVHAAYPEPFGRVVVEALAAGRPIVAVRGEHGPSEILDDHLDARCVAPRGEDLADAVLERLSRGGGSGEAGQRHASKCFDRKVMAERTMAVYRELLEESGAGR